MLRSLAFLSFTSLSLGLGSCGSDSDSKGRSDFVQDVNNIPYAIRRIEIESEIVYRDGDRRSLETTLGSEEDYSQEEVRRKTENGQYVLRVNGEAADIHINADSKFDHRKERKGNDQCRWEGVTDASGTASYDRLEVTWTLTGKITGDDCPTGIEKAYSDFVKNELGSLHLQVLDQIRDSGLIDLRDSERVKIKLKILGDLK
jgi:hypothetical protein